MSLPRPFGPYTLLRRLAVGGMAEIYVAKTRGLGGFEKLVALKLVHPHLSADPSFVRMLIDEAKILVLLTHANIAQVFDLGCIDGTYYIAMEYVEGVDVHGLQKAAAKVKKPLPIEVCCYIVAEMLNGLDYAHRKRDPEGKPLNIVHRDISPQNVLISHAGEVKLVDFGIAKTTLRGEGTEVGVIKGKYYYMSPEQAWADPMDRRSDIFSTGIVLYEMLTGRMLYSAQSIPELIAKVREAEIAPPETLRPDIPPQLSKIVMKALEREVKARYQSALDMGEALRDFLYVTAPSFNAGKLANFVIDLLENQAKIDTGKGSDLTGKLRALTRQEYVRTNNSVIFALDDVMATRAEAPMARRSANWDLPPSGASTPGNALPAPSVSLSPGPSRSLAAPKPGKTPAQRLSAKAQQGGVPASLPPPNVALTKPPARGPQAGARKGFQASVGAESMMESVPPTEVMSVPPGLRQVSVWPLESGRPGEAQRPAEPGLEDPTELWSGNPFKAPPDETLIDAEMALGVANTEMLVRPPVLDGARIARLSDGEEATSKYVPAHFTRGARGRPSLAPSAAITAANGTPALVPPPGEMRSLEPIPPSPPIPDFGPQDRLFGAPAKRRTWAHVGIALLFMALGAIAFQLIRRQKPDPQLEIVSVPAGAKVSVDHKLQNGQTPLRISGLTAGRKYDLRVELPGYVPWEATYHASPGAVRHIAVLKPITGEVHVASEPSGADVWLDGVPIGKTPLTVSSISVGRSVKLRIGHPGYADVRKELTISEDNLRSTLKVTLTKNE